MRIRTLAAAGASAALAVGLLSGPATAQESLPDQINSLEVAAEDRSGYDRDAFGDYDRDALLEANQSKFADCDGYYSRYDATCHGSADDVEVDHLIALAEAWDSGADEWGDSQRDQFAADTANLNLMTSGLNSSKSDQDAAEWTPPAATCHFTNTYVDVKDSYSLSVDEAEKQALLDLASNCGGDGGNGDGDDDAGDGEDKKDNGDDVEEAPEPDPVEGDLEVTG